jgi:hypothetical protein
MPDTDSIVLTVRCETTSNARLFVTQEEVSRALWEDPAGQVAVTRRLRSSLADAIVTAYGMQTDDLSQDAYEELLDVVLADHHVTMVVSIAPTVTTES